MVGIYWLLNQSPMWLTALVLWHPGIVMYLMRDKREGLGYQVAYSAKIGDGCIAIAVLVAATVLQRPGAYIPSSFLTLEYQFIVLGVLVFIGWAFQYFTSEMRSAKMADAYHDIVIAPVIVFLAITLLPVVWYSATTWEIVVVTMAVLVWGWLVIYDFQNGRINQRQWLAKRGFVLKGEEPEYDGR